MRKQEERHIIDILFVIGLFCIFALSTIFLISIGADIYGKTVSNTENNFNDRTSFAYVTEKIRQADRSGAITASTLEGKSALKIQRTVQDTVYITWLYEDEGYLKELMVREDTPLSLSAGQKILPVSDFSVSRIQDNLLQITICTADGKDCSLSVSLKSDVSGSDTDDPVKESADSAIEPDTSAELAESSEMSVSSDENTEGGTANEQ